ncbi:MAG: ATP-binding protein [Oscillospiraceae bacterium]
MEYLKFSAEQGKVDEMINFVFSGMPKKEILNKKLENHIRVACEEVFVNVIDYAYNKQKGDMLIGRIDSNGVFTISVIDFGIPFNPLQFNLPDICCDINNREIGGLGIFLVREIMDDVSYERDGDKNILVMKKRIFH